MAAPNPAYAHCEAFLREHARDQWLAALFIPESLRHHVHALHAFSAEIQRVPDIVSDPRLGEIRLQWWRECLEGARLGEAGLNPVTAALIATIGECRLPVQPLLDLIEAHRFDLYNDAMPGLNDLEGYCGETRSSLIRLTTLVLSGGGIPGGAEACGHAGVALGVTKILRNLPLHARRVQCYVPRDILEKHGLTPQTFTPDGPSLPISAAVREMRDIALANYRSARAGLQLLDASIRPAFIPIAPVQIYLKAVEKMSKNPFSNMPEIAVWRRQWAMWRF